MIGLQYRTASSQQGIASAAWFPTTVPVNTYFSAANLSLTDVPEDTPYLQYRVKYATNRLMEWVTPTLLNVSIGADTVAFAAPPPAFMQPTSSPVSVVSSITPPPNPAPTPWPCIQPTPREVMTPIRSWLTLEWNSTTSTFSIDDPDSSCSTNKRASLPAP